MEYTKVNRYLRIAKVNGAIVNAKYRYQIWLNYNCNICLLLLQM